MNAEPRRTGSSRLKFWRGKTPKAHRASCTAARSPNHTGEACRVGGEDDAPARRPSLVMSARSSLKAGLSRLSMTLFRTKSQQRHHESSESPNPKAKPLSSLPVELQLQVVSHLRLADIISLGATSRSLRQLIGKNEAHIVSRHLKTAVPSYLVKMYPPLRSRPLTLRYLGRLAHRQRVCVRLADLINGLLGQRGVSMDVRSQAEEMGTGIYRKYCISCLMIDGVHDNDRDSMIMWEQLTMSQYSSHDLLMAHAMYCLLVDTFERRLRPPSYAGRLERALRGWTRSRPSDESLSRVMLLGGIEVVERIWRIKNYDERVRTLNNWVKRLDTVADSVSPEALDSVHFPHALRGTVQRLHMIGVDLFNGEDAILGQEGTNRSRTRGSNCELPMKGLNALALKYILPLVPELWRIWYPAAVFELVRRQVVDWPEEITGARCLLETLFQPPAHGDDKADSTKGTGNDQDRAGSGAERLVRDGSLNPAIWWVPEPTAQWP